MALVKRLIRIGNSAGVTIDKAVMKQLGWTLGTDVEFTVDGDELILSTYRYAKDDVALAAGKRIVQKRRTLIQRLAKR